MTITFRNASRADNAGATVTVNKPTGVVQNDFMLVSLEADAIVSSGFGLNGWSHLPWAIDFKNTTDSGWSNVFYKIAGASEGANYSFTCSGAAGVQASIVAYSGVDTNNPFDSINLNPYTGTTFDGSGNVTLTAPYIYTSTDNAMLLWVALADSTSNSTYTAVNTPSGYTNRSSGQDASGWNVCGMAELALSAKGYQAAASAVWTQSGSTGVTNVGIIGAHIALRAAISGNATLTQQHYRFRNDDGSESTATWNAAADTNINLAQGSPIRLRTQIQAALDPASANFQLEYRRVGDALYHRLKVAGDL